jgi:hypothetical protein
MIALPAIKRRTAQEEAISHDIRETVEKSASQRLMENVQMQGFRNPEE